MYVESTSAFTEALRFEVDATILSRLRVVQGGTSRAGVMPNLAMPNTILTSVIASGGRDVMELLSTDACQSFNCLFFGGNDKGVESSGGLAANKPFTDCFAFNNTGLDFDTTQITTTTCSSEDTSGDLTGYTSAELVNFASNDFRTKSSSFLATDGPGPAYVGAFLEVASGVSIPVIMNQLRNQGIS